MTTKMFYLHYDTTVERWQMANALTSNIVNGWAMTITMNRYHFICLALSFFSKWRNVRYCHHFCCKVGLVVTKKVVGTQHECQTNGYQNPCSTDIKLEVNVIERSCIVLNWPQKKVCLKRKKKKKRREAMSWLMLHHHGGHKLFWTMHVMWWEPTEESTSFSLIWWFDSLG